MTNDDMPRTSVMASVV